jgi:hypothetical protein
VLKRDGRHCKQRDFFCARAKEQVVGRVSRHPFQGSEEAVTPRCCTTPLNPELTNQECPDCGSLISFGDHGEIHRIESQHYEYTNHMKNKHKKLTQFILDRTKPGSRKDAAALAKELIDAGLDLDNLT